MNTGSSEWSPYRAVLTVLLLGSTGAFGFGCQSSARSTFESASIGSSWQENPGASFYWIPNPHGYHEEGPKDGQGTYYYVVTSEDGKVIAKAKEEIRGTSQRSLVTEVRGLMELMDVEGHYPFASREQAVQGNGARVTVWNYPPLTNPLSDQDKRLPSGVRQSTWAALANFLEGWPFAGAGLRLQAWLDDEPIPWSDLVAKLKKGQLCSGTVRLVGAGARDE